MHTHEKDETKTDEAADDKRDAGTRPVRYHVATPLWAIPLAVLVAGFAITAIFSRPPIPTRADIPAEVLAVVEKNLPPLAPTWHIAEIVRERSVRLKHLGPHDPVSVRVHTRLVKMDQSLLQLQEEWYEGPSTLPVYEVRSVTFGNFFWIVFAERRPVPIASAIVGSLGWRWDRPTSLKIERMGGFPSEVGATFVLDQQRYTDRYAPDDRPEAYARHSECRVTGRRPANDLHRSLSGEGFSIRCETAFDNGKRREVDYIHAPELGVLLQTKFTDEETGWEWESRVLSIRLSMQESRR